MQEYIDALKNIGLQEYESKAYVILLTQGNLTAKEISQRAEIPQPKVYTILSNLIKKGFCNRVPGQNKKYKALQPKVAFSLMKSEIERRQFNIENVVNRLDKIYYSENKKSVDDFIEVLTNNQQMHERFISLVKNVEHEIVGFVKPPFTTDGQNNNLDIQEITIDDKLKQGIHSRMIYEFPKFKDKDFMPHLERSIKSGENSRIIENLPLKVLIFDERNVLMALNHPNSNASEFTAIVVEHSDLAKAIKLSFEFLWEKAITIEDYKKLRLEY